jgi:SAM-dependent methyltransferase
VAFNVAAEAYDRFMGRYSQQLSPQLANLAGVTAGQRALDVGCGPGALTAELVSRLGADSVVAVDPSASFVAAARSRHPGVDVRQASVESLPFADATFDVALAQLVVHFLADPLAGVREMARVTRHGGLVAACVWDFGGGRGPLGVFWDAARELDPGVEGEAELPGTREGHLLQLFESAGLRDVQGAVLTVRLEHATFESWWEPFTLGVGPAGTYVAALGPEARTALRDRCRTMLPQPPFAVTARAWAARAKRHRPEPMAAT